MRILDYKKWKERDTTFDLILDLIIKINRGEERTLEELLKEEYRIYLSILTNNYFNKKKKTKKIIMENKNGKL